MTAHANPTHAPFSILSLSPIFANEVGSEPLYSPLDYSRLLPTEMFWETEDGKMIVSHEGFQLLARLFGVEMEDSSLAHYSPNPLMIVHKTIVKGYNPIHSRLDPNYMRPTTRTISFGEASRVNLLTDISQRYPDAMAQKRSFDRTIKEHLGLYGIYSEEESEQFRKPTGHTQSTATTQTTTHVKPVTPAKPTPVLPSTKPAATAPTSTTKPTSGAPAQKPAVATAPTAQPTPVAPVAPTAPVQTTTPQTASQPTAAPATPAEQPAAPVPTPSAAPTPAQAVATGTKAPQAKAPAPVKPQTPPVKPAPVAAQKVAAPTTKSASSVPAAAAPTQPVVLTPPASPTTPVEAPVTTPAPSPIALLLENPKFATIYQSLPKQMAKPDAARPTGDFFNVIANGQGHLSSGVLGDTLEFLWSLATQVGIDRAKAIMKAEFPFAENSPELNNEQGLYIIHLLIADLEQTVQREQAA